MNKVNFYALIDALAMASPDALALCWPLTTRQSIDFTFDQFTQQVNAVRQEIFTRGIQPGAVCMLAIPVSPHAIVTILALMAGGAIPLLPPAGMTFRQWRSIRKEHKVSAIITDRHSIKWRILRYFSGVKLIRIAGQQVHPVCFQPALVAETQAALITFSSGSTGQPKAICRSHAVLMQQHKAILQNFPVKAGLDFPLFPNILLHNLANGTATLMPYIPGFQLENLQPKAIVSQIHQQGVVTMTGNVFFLPGLPVMLSPAASRCPPWRQ